MEVSEDFRFSATPSTGSALKYIGLMHPMMLDPVMPHLQYGLLVTIVEFIETGPALTALRIVPGSSKPVKDK